jgi:dienelactone hydrolase
MMNLRSTLARGAAAFALCGLLGTAQAAVVGEEVEYDVDGVKLTGYLAYDDAIQGQRPGVLVVHEWWGHNDYVRHRADMLAEMGYTALALDMYGDGKQASHPEDAQKFMMEVFSNMDEGTKRFVAAREILESHPTSAAGSTAAIGYCFGGNIVLQMARKGMDLKGVASFHGNLSTQNPAQPGAIQSPILVMHGADDPFVPAEQVDAFKAEMTNAGADMRFIAYPGAVHAFTNPGATAMGEQFGLPLKYDEAADTQSWAELDGFLKQVFAN